LIESEYKVEKGTRRLIAMLTVVGVLALAPAAFAQSSGAGYGGQAGGVAGSVGSGGGVAGQTGSGGSGSGGSNDGGGTAGTSAASSATDSNGVLAFTGLDLLLIAGGGLILLAGGVALSRIVARNPA
jgi:hypothetical protein